MDDRLVASAETQHEDSFRLRNMIIKRDLSQSADSPYSEVIFLLSFLFAGEIGWRASL
jgi:hypothetical protein